MNLIENLEEIMYIQGNVMRNLLKIDDLATFQAVMGAVFDEWCARQGMDSAETCQALKNLAEVQQSVHDLDGPFEL